MQGSMETFLPGRDYLKGKTGAWSLWSRVQPEIRGKGAGGTHVLYGEGGVGLEIDDRRGLKSTGGC